MSQEVPEWLQIVDTFIRDCRKNLEYLWRETVELTETHC